MCNVHLKRCVNLIKKVRGKEDKSKSNALKIMVNTFYGANANPYVSLW